MCSYRMGVRLSVPWKKIVNILYPGLRDAIFIPRVARLFTNSDCDDLLCGRS